MQNLQKLYRLYMVTIMINLVMLAIIIRFYAEPFSLMMDPFSWLGKMVTTDGSANTNSLVLFTAALFFNAFMWKQALSLLSGNPVWEYPLLRMLGRLVLIGFFLMAFPCDRFETIHSFGGGFVIGGLWALSTIFLYRSSDEFEPRAFIMVLLVLHASALFCGANFVLDSLLKGFSQRPLLLAIIAVTSLCLRARIQSRTETDYAYGESRLLHNH